MQAWYDAGSKALKHWSSYLGGWCTVAKGENIAQVSGPCQRGLRTSTSWRQPCRLDAQTRWVIPPFHSSPPAYAAPQTCPGAHCSKRPPALGILQYHPQTEDLLLALDSFPSDTSNVIAGLGEWLA